MTSMDDIIGQALRWADRAELRHCRELNAAGVPQEGRAPAPGPFFVREMAAEINRLRAIIKEISDAHG